MSDDRRAIDEAAGRLTGSCNFFHFGLIVTGKGERRHLPKLFRRVMATGICTFTVIGSIGQRNPITSTKRKLKMVGSGKTIPDKDATEIGLLARRYLNAHRCHFVVLIDDLEYERRNLARQVFDRYRLALDSVLKENQKHRAAVHFLVNMLEAYFFADAAAVNAVLNLRPPLIDWPEDVETIRNPKAELKRLFPGFKEVDHGGRILDHLDVEHVLSRPDTCAWLRTLFFWCTKVLQSSEPLDAGTEHFQVPPGRLSDVTKKQIDWIQALRR